MWRSVGRTQRENATEKVGWTSRRVEKRTCNHYTNMFASRLHSSTRTRTTSFQTSRCASSGHDVHLVQCSPPRQLVPCSWVPPSMFGPGATLNGLMTMAAPTFSPRTRTSTRFSEQRHVKTATPYWRDGKSCHRKHVLLALAIVQRVSFPKR